MEALVANLAKSIGKCQFSIEGMKYADPDAIIPVNSSSVFFPAGSWLRAFFHDAGTFVKSPSQGGPKGEGGQHHALMSPLQSLLCWHR
jgi:hypothetical protein